MATREYTLEQACLLAVTGSRAYHLNHALSDTDRMGVFVAPTLDVAGLYWNKHDESFSDAGPEGDDTTMHEVGKFLRLCLKGNPTLIELLYMDEYEVLTEIGQQIVDAREDIISEYALRDAYHGYADSQLYRVYDPRTYKPKMARHVLRIARQGYTLLTTGTLDVKVEDPQEYFDLTELPRFDMLMKISTEVDKLQTCDSVLPYYPNTDKVAGLLESIRKNYI